ncbi:hypothetical protein V494_08118, partial [Pseudogymnoascus sp. VKM F-4513 (FW-928)]
ADIGRDSPAARRRGTDGAAAETRVRSHMKVPAAGHGYVYDWLAGVAAMEGGGEQEQQAQTYSPANRPSPPALTKTRGFRHASPERCDETVPDGRTHRGRRRDSSDSSLVRPAYEGGELTLRRETEEGGDTGEDQTGRISKKAKKHKHKQSVFSTTDDSQSEPELPQHKETFEKRSRHKTKEDRYESKKAKKYIIEDDKPAKKKTVKVKRGDAARASRKAGEDLINGFRSKHVVQDRLTMRPGTGIFKNGRASSPSRNRGLPDLAFSEMQFLKQSSRRPPDSEKEVIISKSGQKTKRERERARNEISNYFIPARQPLREGGVNRGREVSVLPSDTGKTEDTSVLRGQYFHPPASPGEDERDEKALYSHFSARRTSPQKFSLPKPKLDQIFVPRNMTSSSKSASYCTWSESVRSPLTRGKAVLADASSREREMSSTSRQRIAMAGDYKEAGVQAELDPANPLSTRDANDQNRMEDNGEDSMNQFQADRAVLHDCEPHRGSGRPDEDGSGEHLELYAETSVGLKQGGDHAEQSAAEKCTQTGTNGRPQDNPAQPDQANTDPEVQTIMSRAILAQQAYIKRRLTPKVAVEEDAGLSEVRVHSTVVPNATDSGAPKEVSESLEIDRQGDKEASHLLSGLVDDRQNEEYEYTEQDQESIPEYNLPIHGETQSEYVDAAVYQLNEPDDSGDNITGEHDLHEIENAAMPGRIEPPRLMIPTRGFSTGAVRITPVQSRTISPLETMEPIYARQLQSQAFDAHEGQHGLYDAEERGPSEILLYEGGQWERAEALQGYNPTTMENGGVGYGDVYEGQQYGLDLVDESMYYEGELPIDPESQMHDTAAAEGMLFYSQANGPNTDYQWMPRQRTNFSAVTDQVSGLGSWERVQTAAVPQALTMQFWRPRRGY